MKFQKGISGNPAGRPRGTPDKRTRLRALLEPHSAALVGKAVEKAMEGDGTALRLCLERLIPPFKATTQRISLRGMPNADTATERAEIVLRALGDGEIAADDASAILAAIGQQVRVSEMDDLERRLAAIEAKA